MCPENGFRAISHVNHAFKKLSRQKQTLRTGMKVNPIECRVDKGSPVDKGPVVTLMNNPG